jgi:hypothetical protein
MNVLAIAILFMPFWLALGNSMQQQDDSPGKKLRFLIGEWKAQLPGNHFRMRVEWDSKKKQFKGFLTKQGVVSADVGFTVGEHVWTAQPISEPCILVEVQKWRSGSAGVSTKFEWKVGTVNLEKSSEKELFTSTAMFVKVK